MIVGLEVLSTKCFTIVEFSVYHHVIIFPRHF